MTEKNINDPQKMYRIGTVRKNILLEGLNRFHGANITLNSDLDQDIDIWFGWKTPNLSMHHFIKHINQNIKNKIKQR